MLPTTPIQRKYNNWVKEKSGTGYGAKD